MFDEHKNITKKNFPNGALLIDSEFRVSAFNVPVLHITDNENTKCPIHFYCVETIYFVSTSFETTADVDYATFVAYSVGNNFSSVKSLPKICYKFMLQLRSDAKSHQTNNNIDVIDFQDSECFNIEIKDFSVKQILTNKANLYITYGNGDDIKNVVPSYYRQYSNIENMVMNTRFNRSKYISMFGHTSDSMYKEYLYPRLDTLLNNEFVGQKKLHEGLNFGNIETDDLTKNTIMLSYCNETIEYLKNHLDDYFKKWKIMPVTEIDQTIPTYVKKSPVMLQLAMETRYKDLIIVDLRGDIMVFNSKMTLTIKDNDCTELPFDIKYVDALEIKCQKLTTLPKIEYANTVSIANFQNNIQKLTLKDICCGSLAIVNNTSSLGSINELDISKIKTQQLTLSGFNVGTLTISNKLKSVKLERYPSTVHHVYNVDMYVTQPHGLETPYENKFYDSSLDNFYDDIPVSIDYEIAKYIITDGEKNITESFNFNDIHETTFGDKDYVGSFVDNFLEACSYNKKYNYTINDDLTVDIETSLIVIDNETYTQDTIPFKINHLHGTLLMDHAHVKNLDFMPNTITGSLTINCCTHITEIDGLPDVSGFIDITKNKNLTSIKLYNYELKKLLIVGNKNLTHVELNMEKIQYMKIQENPSLEKIIKFPYELLGSVVLYNNRQLSDISSISNSYKKGNSKIYIANTKISMLTIPHSLLQFINVTTTKGVTR